VLLNYNLLLRGIPTSTKDILIEEGRRQRAEGRGQKGIQTPPDLEPSN